MKVYDTIHDAYLGILEDIMDAPDHVCAPRGQWIREKIDYSFRVLNPVSEPVVTLDKERNKVIADYSAKELAWYLSGDNSVDAAAKCSNFWKQLDNGDGTINSNYGYLIFHLKDHGNAKFSDKMRTPWDWARNALIKDKDTRQAIMRFSRPEHFFDGVKDFTCTMHGIFQIRENKLNFSVVMRSNDAVLGIPYDSVFFIHLMDKMLTELKSTYPDLKKGHYTHTVHSFHIYERDLVKVKKMLGIGTMPWIVRMLRRYPSTTLQAILATAGLLLLWCYLNVPTLVKNDFKSLEPGYKQRQKWLLRNKKYEEKCPYKLMEEYIQGRLSEGDARG